MNLTRIEGPATVCHCAGCSREGLGGTEPFTSASSGEIRQPEDWYLDPENLDGIYCATCAAKLSEADPTRSINQFFLDTEGTMVDPTIL